MSIKTFVTTVDATGVQFTPPNALMDALELARWASVTSGGKLSASRYMWFQNHGASTLRIYTSPDGTIPATIGAATVQVLELGPGDRDRIPVRQQDVFGSSPQGTANGDFLFTDSFWGKFDSGTGDVTCDPE